MMTGLDQTLNSNLLTGMYGPLDRYVRTSLEVGKDLLTCKYGPRMNIPDMY